MYLHSPYDGVTWDSATSLVSSDGKPSSAFIATGNSRLHLIWLDQRDGYSAVNYKQYSPVRWPIRPVPHRFDLGYVDSGDCFDTAIYFYDTVAIPLKITLDSIFGTGISLDRTTFPVTIGPFGSPMSVLRIPVGCCAEKVQDYYDTVLFSTEDTAAKQERFLFKWRGVPAPTLSVSRSIVEFGTIDSGATSQQALR